MRALVRIAAVGLHSHMGVVRRESRKQQQAHMYIHTHHRGRKGIVGAPDQLAAQGCQIQTQQAQQAEHQRLTPMHQGVGLHRRGPSTPTPL